MKNQSTTKSSFNPYSTVLFTPSSVTNQVQNIIDSTLEELQEINAKKSKKKFTYTLSNYISTFLKKTDNDDDNYNRSKTDEQNHQISSFTTITQFDENPKSAQRSVKINFINPINPGSVLPRPASAPPIQRELPTGPDPSHLMKTPPERYLLPPFLWGKTTKQVSTSSDYEDVQQAPPPPVHRRRGRPRKNPLPDDYYSNNHSNTNLLKYHSAQISIHSSNSATFVSSNSTKTNKKNKTTESTAFLESPKETTDSINTKTDKNSTLENTEENSTSSLNVTPVRTSSSEVSIKLEQPQKVKQKDSASSSDSNNESESDIEPDEAPILAEERPPKQPDIIFPDSDIDEICASRNKNSEYLVKFVGKAYKDAEWISKDNLMKNPNYEPTVLSFERYGINTQEPYFNPLFQTPERILDYKENLYLIKWTGLGYKYSTWEVLDDLNITKSNLNSLIENFESLQRQPNIDPNLSITYQPININDQFSLDDLQNEVVDSLYNKFCSNSDTNLYGTIGSILRLEIAALFSVLKSRHSLFGPYLLVVAPPILKLASCEMSTYTNLTVLTIPDDDEDEFNYIKDNAFIFQNEIPKFNIVVVSSTNFQRFTNDFPQLNYIVAAVDTSEISELPLPNIHTILATMRITVKKRTDKEEVIDSQDDSTFLHSEFTIFSPMLKSQRALYQQTIRDNIDIVTTPPNKIDKSRLYEVVTKLCSLANSPACLNSQEVVFKMANPMMKKKRFEDSGKMRVLRELINHAQSQNKRLMVMCRDPVVLDTLQLYVTAYEIPYVHVGALGLKRMKLDDFSPEAKANKNIIVLAQFGKQAINWLPLMLDIIVVFDGVYNPMYYFSHAARKPRKRDCIIIRLLAEDSHEAYLGSCADHYEDLPMYDIFKAAAETFMRPARESVIANSKYLKNARYDNMFKATTNSFQYIFDEEKSAKISAQSSKGLDAFEDDKNKEALNSAQASRKKANLKSISSSSSTSNLLKLPLSGSPQKASLFPPFLKSSKKNAESSGQESAEQGSSAKKAEIGASKSSPEIKAVKPPPQPSQPPPPPPPPPPQQQQQQAPAAAVTATKTIVTKLESSSPKSDNSDISGDEIEDTDEQAPAPPPPKPPQQQQQQQKPLAPSIQSQHHAAPSAPALPDNAKKQKSVQISAPPPQPPTAPQMGNFVIHGQFSNLSNFASQAGGISVSGSAASIEKKFQPLQSVGSEPNLLHARDASKRKRVLKRKIRLEPGQPCPPKPEHGTITIHHHHRRISSSFSTGSSAQLQLQPSSSQPQNGQLIQQQPLVKASSSMYARSPIQSTDFFYKFADIPRNIGADSSDSSLQWTQSDIEVLLVLLSNHPWGQWGLISNIMGRRFTLPSIVDASYAAVGALIDSLDALENRKSDAQKPRDFVLIRRVVNDHKKQAAAANRSAQQPSIPVPLLSDFVSHLPGANSIRFRLSKVSCMVVVAVVMAASTSPPSDIYTAPTDSSTLPAPWWKPEVDDKQLVYFVWNRGFSLFACQRGLWSNPSFVRSEVLISRFMALMKETEVSIVCKSNIVFPHVLKEHLLAVVNKDQVDFAKSSSVAQVVSDFGFIDIDDICRLTGQLFDQTINTSIALTQCANVQVIADFFERIRHELYFPGLYYAEDYQFIEAVEFHGRSHSNQSLLIQSIYEKENGVDFADIVRKILLILENRKREPFDHSNTPFNSIGHQEVKMPFILSNKIKINNLGEISLKSGFHSNRYIYPVGYEAVTTFASTFEPNTTDRYLCQIIDNGMESPIFKVTSMSKKTVFQDVMPDKVWKQVADKVSYINSMNMFESIKTPGHELFGLSFPTTIRLIQSMKGCDQCMKYRIRAFKVPFENLKH